ncbi:glycosyltransferase 87 family protein [Tardiphaga sp.]|uniref:glycosyltransferase 87 family protein n=1 Tax=Tardiphaga sp. TaxID=1926292 RepID=UPI002628424F|nr:glycosyltransferase 87 family protein [Tardiphaga sp.]
MSIAVDASAPRRKGWTTLAIVVASMALGAAYAAYLGEDANWDWQNYHEYNIWALLHGGYERDAIPPGFQTFFNPLIYFPWYALRHALPPLAAGMIIGAVHGLNLAVVAWLSKILLGVTGNAWTIGAAVLLAAFGPMTLSEVGASFSDILTSIPSLIALALILEPERPRPWRYLVAGLLLGLTVGIKLTNIVFALGIAAMALIAVQPLLALACLAIGGAVGSVLTGGAWSLMLWREFGNPFFPLVNSFFPSAEMKQVTLLDRQFIPRGFWDGVSYPFLWMVGDFRSSELPFRDARFALAIVLLPLAIVASLKSAAARLTRRDVQLLVFFAVSLAIWLTLFSIQRYVVLLELLCGPIIVLLLTRIGSAFVPSRSISNFAIFAIAAIASAWTQPTDWWRRPWSNPYAPVISPRLAQPATYFLLDKPLSFIAPQLPEGSRFAMIADQALPIMPGGRFDRRIRDGLSHPLPGGVWEIHIKGRPYPVELLAAYGLSVDTTQACVEIEGANMGLVLVACPLRDQP